MTPTCSCPRATGRSRRCWSSSTRRRRASAGASRGGCDFALQLAQRGFVTLSLGSDPAASYPDKEQPRAPAALVPRLRRRQLLQRPGEPARGRREAHRRGRPLLRRQVGDVRLLPVRQVRLRRLVRPRHRLRRDAAERQLLGAVVSRLRAGPDAQARHPDRREPAHRGLQAAGRGRPRPARAARPDGPAAVPRLRRLGGPARSAGRRSTTPSPSTGCWATRTAWR